MSARGLFGRSLKVASSDSVERSRASWERVLAGAAGEAFRADLGRGLGAVEGVERAAVLRRAAGSREDGLGPLSLGLATLEELEATGVEGVVATAGARWKDSAEGGIHRSGRR